MATTLDAGACADIAMADARTANRRALNPKPFIEFPARAANEQTRILSSPFQGVQRAAVTGEETLKASNFSTYVSIQTSTFSISSPSPTIAAL